MPDFWAKLVEPADPLAMDLIAMIKQRNDATPRHLQKDLGPSEVAHPCMRKMAFGMMDVPRCNPPYDPLPSIIGGATHKWLDSAAMYANTLLGRQRWLSETKVNVAPGLSGTADLYDGDTGTVVDWKVPGDNRFKQYKHDPGPVYKNQVFLYGKGFENAGLAVKTVAIALLPVGKTLRSMHVWKADYDPAIADRILAHRDAVIGLLDEFQVESHPARYEWVPITPYDCGFCPWFRPEPETPLQCKGDQ